MQQASRLQVTGLIRNATGGDTGAADVSLVLACVERVCGCLPAPDSALLLLYLASFDAEGTGMLPLHVIEFALHAPLGTVTVDKVFCPRPWPLTLIECAFLAAWALVVAMSVVTGYQQKLLEDVCVQGGRCGAAGGHNSLTAHLPRDYPTVGACHHGCRSPD